MALRDRTNTKDRRETHGRGRESDGDEGLEDDWMEREEEWRREVEGKDGTQALENGRVSGRSQWNTYEGMRVRDKDVDEGDEGTVVAVVVSMVVAGKLG